jgi:hypothetical protein
LRSPSLTNTPVAEAVKHVDDSLISSSTIVCSQGAELYRWDLATQTFIKPEPEEYGEQRTYAAEILKRNCPGFEYWLMVSSVDGPFLAHKILPSMNQRWSSTMNSFTWNHLGEDGKQSSWCLRFLSEEAYVTVLSTFTQALWETLHQYSWEKLKVSECR